MGLRPTPAAASSSVTGASIGHEALIALAYCAGILFAACVAASWLFRNRTSA